MKDYKKQKYVDSSFETFTILRGLVFTNHRKYPLTKRSRLRDNVEYSDTIYLDLR